MARREGDVSGSNRSLPSLFKVSPDTSQVQATRWVFSSRSVMEKLFDPTPRREMIRFHVRSSHDGHLFQAVKIPESFPNNLRQTTRHIGVIVEGMYAVQKGMVPHDRGVVHYWN